MIARRIVSLLLLLAFTAHGTACGQAPSSAAAPAETTPPTTTTAAPPTTPAATTTAAPPTAATPQETTGISGTIVTTKQIYCPPINKLKKIDLFWGAPNGWRSYSQSFVNTIATFSGAQWVGINVGKMLCVYKGKETFEFPVVLQNDTLTPVPEGDKWVKQPGGYINCLSGEISDCPFKFEEAKANDKDVYKELDFFKGKEDYLKNPSPTN